VDANGLRFWMLANEADWRDHRDTAYDAARRSLRLASTRVLEPVSGAAGRAQAQTRLNVIPQALDEFGARAFWDTAARRILARSSLPGTQTVYAPPPGRTPTDLAVGYDGVLYVAVGGRVVMRDLRDRWDEVTVAHDAAASAAGFTAWRLAADPAGGVWVLDRDRGRLARVRGTPFPSRPQMSYAPTTFRPEVENPDAPLLSLAVRPTLEADETLVALAVGPGGNVALLSWRAARDAGVRIVQDGRLSAPRTLDGARSPYSLAWLSETRIALLLPRIAEAPAYDLPQDADQFELEQRVEVAGDLYPVVGGDSTSALPRHDRGPFLHDLSLPPRLGVLREPTAAEIAAGQPADRPVADVRPLHRVSLPAYEKRGEARNFGPGLDRSLDSGTPETLWHRLYVEASFPPGCGAIVWLTATDTRLPPPFPAADAADAPEGIWHPHAFGGAPAPSGFTSVPRAAWVSQPSEVPFHAGLLHCPPAPGRAGLFTALVQRAARPAKTLRGRYLWVRVALYGDGRATPDIAAVRAYASRFSFVDRYLPELYRETQFGPEADAIDARATPADFLERFVGNFEGVLTTLEDRVAEAYVLTLPSSTPDSALPWLASWTDAAPPLALPAQRSREWLKAAPFLHRRRGTLGGLRLALELATGGSVFRVPAGSMRAYRALTDDAARLARPPAAGDLVLVDTRDASVSLEALLLSAEGVSSSGEVTIVAGGAVSGGEIIVIEDYRLRRVVATILGADFADESDPLLPGLAVSGNSIVGDTLMLGDEERREFLALFSAELDTTAAEDQAIAALFERLAHRATVLAHQALEPVDLELVRAVAGREAPAHVQVRVIAARYPFLAGIASLVGLDTYLARKPRRMPVRVQRSVIGERDFVLQAAALDPRTAGAPPRPTT
jgi:phage tail-like protein